MRTGVLLMAHGTPSSLDDMPEYLRLVRGGRPASPDLIAQMRRNYEAIGGRSPLTDITRAQAAALRARLGPTSPVAVGMRYWQPFIKDALADLAAAGVDRVIGIPLAPQFSTLSVQKYVDTAIAALPDGMRFEAVHSFATHPRLIEAFAERLLAAQRHDAAQWHDEAQPNDNAQPNDEAEIVFTAHSLPVRVIDAGDRYAEEVAATARGVAARAGIGEYQIAYQSAGRTPEPWMGPDLSDLIRERAAIGRTRFLAVPIGFVCDHTEILFDVDVRAATAARECGATLRRTESLNTSPTFIAMLEDLVQACR